MKRILLVLTVALVMAAMMAVSAMPAFATSRAHNGCIAEILENFPTFTHRDAALSCAK